MKKMAYYALAATLLIGAGCKKKDESPVQQTETKTATQPMKETAAPAPAETQTMAAKAEAVGQQMTEQTKEAVTTLKVKAEDVMADLNQPVEQIKEKVAGFDKTQLLAYADQYKSVLLEKKDQIAALTEQVKALPVTELMGDKAKALKSQLSQYTEELSGLKDRYSVYLQKLDTFGVDLSAYGL